MGVGGARNERKVKYKERNRGGEKNTKGIWYEKCNSDNSNDFEAEK